MEEFLSGLMSIAEFFYDLVEFQKRHLWEFLFVLILITGVMLFYGLRIEVDSSLDQMVKPEDPYLTLQGVLADEFGQTESYFVAVTVDKSSSDLDTIKDLRDPEVIHAIDQLEQSLLEEPEVTSTVSIASVLKRAFGRLPNSIEESKELIRMLGPAGENMYSSDMSATLVTAAVNVPKKSSAQNDSEARMKKRVDDAPLPLGITATLTGFPTLLNQIVALMIRDSIVTLGVALAFVFFALLFFFRNFSYSIIAITSVVVAVIWLGGFLSLTGIGLSVSNATVAAMVIGLGVDYSIHLVNSFETKVKKFRSRPVSNTMKVVGRALTISFITTFVGFSMNLLGNTEGIRIQGVTLAVGVLFVFIATMLIVPMLLRLKIIILREEFGVSRWK